MNSSSHNRIATDGLQLFLLPVETRVPLKFGTETLTSVTCARIRATLKDDAGASSSGWGETPLNVQWVWPSPTSYHERLQALTGLIRLIGCHILENTLSGHPMDMGHQFTEFHLPQILESVNAERSATGLEPIPWLAALVCFSPFDIAFHDAYARHNNVPVHTIYGPDWMEHDLSHYIEAAPNESSTIFSGKYPKDFMRPSPAQTVKVWHLVGGLDPLTDADLDGSEPDDGYPVTLIDWISRDGLQCLKIKLRGNDAEWDFNRLFQVGQIAENQDVLWLTADFNCTVKDPAYVNDILDRLRDDFPSTYARLLYVEQPFPYELDHLRLNVRSVSARKPLFLDESAHDWKMVRLGYELGWSGVALKTCKTQTGAILSACWALAHGMTLMVQDLTNPMLAQIPHCLLAACFPTIMGVESNGMQFYPEASRPEMQVHPGLYRRSGGELSLATLGPFGFGYREDEIERTLPDPETLSP